MLAVIAATLVVFERSVLRQSLVILVLYDDELASWE